MNLSPKVKAAAASYVRAFLVAAAGLYAGGVHDYKAIGIAAIAAVIGPVLRAVNSKDPAFGLVAKLASAKLDEVAAVEVAKAKVKAPTRAVIKKAPAKKAVAPKKK